MPHCSHWEKMGSYKYLHKLTNPDFFPFFSRWEKYWEQNGEKNENLQKISGNCAPGINLNLNKYSNLTSFILKDTSDFNTTTSAVLFFQDIDFYTVRFAHPEYSSFTSQPLEPVGCEMQTLALLRTAHTSPQLHSVCLVSYLSVNPLLSSTTS